MIQKLKESTDVVKSNKQVMKGMILWGMFYLGAFLLQLFINLPKLDNLLSQIVKLS